MKMHMSAKGAGLLEVREGKRKKAYKDTKGIWTIGVGHTGPEVVQGLVWTDHEIAEAFDKDMDWAEEEVNAVGVCLTQNQFDALVSFVFNIGATAFRKSTIRRLLKAGDYEGAAKQFDRWIIPKEITGRRMSEKAQFLN